MSHGVAKRAYAHTHGWALIQGHYCPSTESKTDTWDFPGGPVVKNPPANAGDWRSIPGPETKIPHALGQLSPCTTTSEPTL